MKNIIRIKNAVFYAYHGAMKEEQSIGGRYEADVELYTDFTEAAETDNLRHTINYHNVYKYINKKVNEKKYYLIETIAMVIADGLLKDYSALQKVSVKIRKSNVPIGGVIDFVEAEVIKERDE
jgi:dihydroneopterin aldolase